MINSEDLGKSKVALVYGQMNEPPGARMRVALSVDFGILVAAELLAGDLGMGYIIQDASTFFNVEALFVGILMIAFFGVISDFLLRLISARVVHWQG